MIDDFIQQILFSAVPLNESLKSSDFQGNVQIIREKIIDLFRFTSIQLAPSFLGTMLKHIQEDVCSQDKKKRFGSAVSLTALMSLFPFDEYIPQYRGIIEKLIIPGYKPLVNIGAAVVGRMARIRGNYRDSFLKELIELAIKDLSKTENPDCRYASAVIWREIAENAPEHFFRMGTSFATIITNALILPDRIVNEILISTIEILFNSESAALGADFLTEMHNLLLFSTIKSFSELKKTEDLVITYQLLLVLIKLKPYLSSRNAESLIVPQCKLHLVSQNYELMSYSVKTLLHLHKIQVYQIDDALYDIIMGTVFDWVIKNPSDTYQLCQESILTFGKSTIKIVQQFIVKFNHILSVIPSTVSAPLVFDLSIAAIVSFPENNPNILLLISNIPNILARSPIPMPIHKLLSALNLSHPRWSVNFIVFRNQIIQILRLELITQSINTDRLVITLLSLQELKVMEPQDAIKSVHLVLRQIDCKDIDVRRNIVGTVFKLYRHIPGSIPLQVILKLVKFALDDSIRTVRIESLKSFTKETYSYISQQEIFPLFCRFTNDESFEVRKAAFGIIQNLKGIDLSLMRSILFNSLKQMNPNLSVIVPGTTPTWIVFPNLIDSISSIIDVYAIQLYDMFSDLLTKRFRSYSDKSLVYTNSAILKDIDTCLIKSISKLYIKCPKIVPLTPIIDMMILILDLPVHHWTKIECLKALKRLSINGVQIGKLVLSSLISIIQSNMSSKLVTKTLKVIGSLGLVEINNLKKKHSLIYRSSLSNPIHFKHFFVNTIFKYMLNQFQSMSIISLREAIFHCAASLFHLEPSIIPQFLEPFLNPCLEFISQTKTERLPIFFTYLTHIINDSGFLIVPHSVSIFHSLEEHWHNDFTKEVSLVFCALIISSKGECDSIIHQLASISFLILKSKPDTERFGVEIFQLLRSIGHFCDTYLSSIINGIVDILQSSNSTNFIHSLSLDTLEFIICECKSEPYISSIKRSLILLSLKSQNRWRDRANQLLNIIANPPNNQFSDYGSFIPSDQKSIEQMNYEQFYTKLKNIVSKSKKIPNENEINGWYNDFLTFLVKFSPYSVIKAMSALPSYPPFAFKFAFLASWIFFSSENKIKAENALNKILQLKNIPKSVLIQFIKLFEFATMCSISIRINQAYLIFACDKLQQYHRALFFLEYQSLMNDFDNPDDITEQLIHYNNKTGRYLEAHTIAKKYQKCGYKTWMSLGEWSTALIAIESEPQVERLIPEKIECLASIEKWNDVLKYASSFEMQSLEVQMKLARYFWMAELYSGNKDKALHYVDSSSGYSIEDCIQKAILFISYKDIPSAQSSIHLGWRYLSSCICSVEKHDVLSIQNYQFQASQLHQLQEVIKGTKNPSRIPIIQANWNSKQDEFVEKIEMTKKLYQINTLIPNIIDLEQSSLSIIQQSIDLGKTEETLRLARSFYHDENSEGFQYTKLLIAFDSVSKDFLKHQMNNFAGFYKSQLEVLIGCKILEHYSSFDDLKEAVEYFRRSSSNYENYSTALLMASLVGNSYEIVMEYLKTISKLINNNSKSASLHLVNMFSILMNFSHNDSLDNHIFEIFDGCDPKIFSKVSLISLILVLSGNTSVSISSSKLYRSMLSSFSEIDSIHLYRESRQNPKNQTLLELIDVVQESHPIVFSHISTISQKLIDMRHNLFDESISALSLYIANKDVLYPQKLLNILQKGNLSQYENDFKSHFGDRLIKLCNLLISDPLNEQNIENSKQLLNSMIRRQDSIRIIPLSSLDEFIDRKKTWQIQIPLKGFLTEVRLSHFFHSVQRLENSFNISLVGVDGKKYDFVLGKSSNPYSYLSDHFISLLHSYSKPMSFLQSRTHLQLSFDTTLIESIKGFEPMVEIISSYRQSQGFCDANSELMAANMGIRSLICKAHDRFDLSRAILVSSSSSFEWITKQSSFSNSYGCLSAFSLIMGGVDHSLNSILYNRISGNVSHSEAILTVIPQVVPFRLTRMIVTAFGTPGLSGPFKTSFMNMLSSIRKNNQLMASILHFYINNPPFNNIELPNKYHLKETTNSNVDILNERFIQSSQPEEEFETLVNTSTSLENLCKMPITWIPWW